MTSVVAQQDRGRAVGSTSRLTQRISVDLPAPDGPIRPMTWPSPDRQVDAAQREVAGRGSALARAVNAAACRRRSASLAGVDDAHGLIDLAHHLPVLLVR